MHACNRSAASCTDDDTHLAPRNRHQRTAKASAGSSRFPTVWPSLRNIMICTLSPRSPSRRPAMCAFRGFGGLRNPTADPSALTPGADCHQPLSPYNSRLSTMSVVHRQPAAQRRHVAAARASSALRRQVVQPPAHCVRAAGRRSDPLAGSNHTSSSCGSRGRISARHWQAAYHALALTG